MEALEMGVRQSMTRSTSQLSTITDGAAGQCNTFDGNQLEENGKPKRTFENMTIHRQYMEYNAIKELRSASLGRATTKRTSLQYPITDPST